MNAVAFVGPSTVKRELPNREPTMPETALHMVPNWSGKPATAA